MPDNYAQAWAKLDAEYAARLRQAIATRVESLLSAHHWDGGYYCRCGEPVDLPTHWGRHLLELALFDDDDLPEP
jgi:hypothetical protein